MAAPPILSDPTMLRAIAHPVRNRILGELAAQGSLRAADLARELDIPANQASFHLRQLAKYGLIEEDPGAARDKRDRVWRATAAEGYTVRLGEVEKTPGGKAAAAVYRSHAAAQGHAMVDAAYAPESEKGIQRSIMEHSVRLTKEEAVELGDELSELLNRWTDRTRGRDDERRTYVVFQIIQPFPGPAGSTTGTAEAAR